MVRIRNTLHHFGIVSIGFHWFMAGYLIFLLVIGYYMVYIPLGILKIQLFAVHKQYGMVALILTLLRFSWRLSNVRPILLARPSFVEELAIRSAHLAFYFLAIVLPLTGWLASSAAGLSVSMFDVYVLPDLIKPDESLLFIMLVTHKWFSYAFTGIILGHMGAALIHHFILKDDTLRRMLSP